MDNHSYKFLVFDISITGHHSEYIGHLVDYLYEKKGEGTHYFFVVNPEFSIRFPKIASKAKKIANLTWQEISRSEFASINGGKIKTSWKCYRILNRYARIFKVDHVCALDFHAIKYGAIFLRPSYTFSGILFVQFYRLGKDSLKGKWIYGKRYFLSKLHSFNKKIIRIFILNDEKTVSYMNHEFGRDIYKLLPDPIPENPSLPDFDVHEHFGIEKGRKIFLHIGSLGSRKGTFEVVDSAQEVMKEKQEQISILLAGKAINGEEENIILHKMEVQNKNSNVQLCWDNRFLPTSMMQSLFNQCYAVLLPYKNAEYSSGILGHAAAANKMVIATDTGLLKEMVSDNDLGLLLDRPDPVEIAKKMVEALTYTFSSSANKKFVDRHSPEMFASLILEPENRLE